MRRMLAHVGIVVIALSAVAFAQTPTYKQVDKFVLGGEGGWDYITYEPTDNRLYIGHNSSIYVVDAATGKKIGEVPATGAHGAAAVPEKGLGFSSNGKAGTVTVFDLKTLAPKTDIKVGENPDAIIYDSYSKKVIVMNGRSKDVMAIDPDSLKVIATVPLGGKLEYAATDPGHIYVNVEDTGEIAVVDSKNWKAVARWKLEGCEEPSGLVIDAKMHRLFSVCGNAKMMVVDTASGKTVASVPTGNRTDGIAFDPALQVALSSNGEGTMTVVRETPEGKYEVAENVQTQQGARTVAVDPKTHRAYLPTAEFGPPAEGQKRPSIKPGTFSILVLAPEQKSALHSPQK
jgi:YVTN family beta-propeller protein